MKKNETNNNSNFKKKRMINQQINKLSFMIYLNKKFRSLKSQRM